jgi:branched-chain amino acid transport system permease protein
MIVPRSNNIQAALSRRIPDPAHRRLALTLPIAAAALLFPVLHGNDADLDAITNALTYAVLALGLNIVVGFTGLLDLGYAAFFAIGAYAYGILASFQLMPHWSPGWVPLAFLDLVRRVPSDDGSGDLVRFTFSFWLMLPGSAALAAICGVLFGAPTLRLRGDYLAIVTLGFGEIVPIVARNWTGLTNGAQGLNGIAAPRLFGYRFGIAAMPYYYVSLLLIAALIAISLNLRRSRIGRAWMAIREDDIAAAAAGIDRTRFKLLAFAIGAAFAGLAGTAYVAKLHTATPEMFGFPVSVMILVMVVLGGMGSVWGVVAGAMLLSLLQSWFLPSLSDWLQSLGRLLGNAWLQQVQLAQASELIFGCILVLMMLFRREGLIPATHTRPGIWSDPPGTPAAPTWTLPRFDHPSDAPALHIKGIMVRFGGLVALNAIDITVPAGGVVAVIGPNGSGKSTLFNVITGLTPPAAGSIHLFGADITGRPPHAIAQQGAARTFQNIRLFAALSVLDNVLIGLHARLRTGPLGAILRLRRSRAEEARARADAIAILALFGNHLLPRLDHPASSLSYANRRRVEIARALASRPRILLLDEPTAGMNPNESAELAEQISRLHGLGLTILLIEHKLDVVTRLADTVIVLDHGDKLAQGTAAAVRADPAVLTAYLGRNAAAGSAAFVA